MTALKNQKNKVFAPLYNFNLEYTENPIFSIANFGNIEAIDQSSLDLSDFHEVEKEDLLEVPYCLSFEHSPDEPLESSEKINIFLLALWIVIPTATKVQYKFIESSKAINKPDSRFLDRFNHNSTQATATQRVTTYDLEKLQALIDSMKSICINKKRLWNSLILTLHGCNSKEWQIAFICYSAAAEGILTYTSGNGINERLAKSFACLTKKSIVQRNRAFLDFKQSYSTRSKIMHGTINNLNGTSDDRLRNLANFSDILRDLWETILVSESIISELEKNDKQRKKFFLEIEEEYSLPETS